jgi:hypothetical protein
LDEYIFDVVSVGVWNISICLLSTCYAVFLSFDNVYSYSSKQTAMTSENNAQSKKVNTMHKGALSAYSVSLPHEILQHRYLTHEHSSCGTT